MFIGKSKQFFTPVPCNTFTDEDIRLTETLHQMTIIKDKIVCSKLIRTMYCES